MLYTGYTIPILVIVVRQDVGGVFQRSAWAGWGSFPFGAYDCPGWTPHLLRLSNVFASARRRSHRTGVVPVLINVRPYTSDGEYAVLNYRLDCHPQQACPYEMAHLHRLAAHIIGLCRHRCQVCGQRAVPAILGGIWCHRHAPRRFAFEVVQDKRKLVRSRRRWLNLSNATMTKYIERHSGVYLPLYVVSGVHYFCISDAPPGFRQQTLESLVDQGMTPVDVEGEWLFRSFRRVEAKS